MGPLGCCGGCRAEPPRGTSSPLGRGWEGAGGSHSGCGTRPAGSCSAVSPGWDGTGWGAPAAASPFLQAAYGPSRGRTGLAASILGERLDRAATGATRKALGTASPGPLCAPQQWSQPLFTGAPSTPNAGEEQGRHVVPGRLGYAASPLLAGTGHGPSQPLASLLPARSGGERAMPSHW